ncbi:MAG: hypothetical protein WCK37_04945 [Candidatus Falkowbacteria bacterium]
MAFSGSVKEMEKYNLVENSNVKARKDVRSLKAMNNDFINDTFSAAELKRKFSLSDIEIEHIESCSSLGKIRYNKIRVFNFIKNNIK